MNINTRIRTGIFSCRGLAVAAAALAALSAAASIPMVAIPDKPTDVEKFAASELADELGKCLGYRPIVVCERATRKGPVLYVGATRAAKEARGQTSPYQVDEVFLKSVPLGVVMDGDPARGPIYAADIYLEKYCGVRWWTSDAAFHPSFDEVPVKGIDFRYAPQFKYRETYYLDGLDPLFKVRSKGNFTSLTRYMLSDMKFVPPEMGGNHRLYFFEGRHSAYHSFFEILPPKVYFEKHPEWYSLVKGKREAKQLCLANEEMKAEYIKETLRRLREDPSVDFIQVSQNDGRGGWCECDRCRAMMEEDGGAKSGPYIRFANAVAEAVEKEFPDVRIDTFAYVFTTEPPAKTRPRHNVVVRYCTYKCDIARPLDDPDSPKNSAFRGYLEAWSRIAGGNLFIWNYLADFHTYMMPHPNVSQIAKDVRLFAKNGAVGVFEQGDALCSAGTFAGLRHYLASHLLWNPGDDENRLMDEFLVGYYGKAAAPHMRRFIEFLDTSARKPGAPVKLNHDGLEFLTRDEVLDLAAIMDAAVAAAEGEGGEFAAKARRERLSVDNAFLRDYDALRELAAKKGVAWTRPENRAEAVENWIRAVKALGVRAVRETTSAAAIEEYFRKLRGEKPEKPGSFVTYEEFGAVGDGKTDDQKAIVAAHNAANEKGLPVRAGAGKTYYIGKGAAVAVIKTDVDFGTAKFIIDDRELDNYKAPVFRVDPSAMSFDVKGVETLAAGQKNLGVKLPGPCLVEVQNNTVKQYIRYGRNQNNGTAQREMFLADASGAVDPRTPIVWDYKAVTGLRAHPVDEKTLVVRGGSFTTIANQAESKYNYNARGIAVRRSNVRIEDVRHYVEGEGDHGAPYGSFVGVSFCANVMVSNCLFTAHKTYSTIGSAGKPVSMGSYDISANNAVNVSFVGCRQTTDINDRRYWGIFGSNYCKNLLYDGCVFSRFDAHMGVANATVRNCELGYMGINAIGFGTFLVENTTVRCRTFFNLRSDYGSTWRGEFIVRNCVFVPGNGDGSCPILVNGVSTDWHDFGYSCEMPRRIVFDGLRIDDTRHPKFYDGPFVFAVFNARNKGPEYVEKFPYKVTEEVVLRNVTTATGKSVLLSPNKYMFRNVKLR